MEIAGVSRARRAHHADVIRLARWVLIRNYLRVYHRRPGLDRRTLRYYLAWAALRRLGVCGMWLRAGPQSNGCKPSSICNLQTGHVEALQECFRRCTGVEARGCVRGRKGTEAPTGRAARPPGSRPRPSPSDP
jgi:hypothetical protein